MISPFASITRFADVRAKRSREIRTIRCPRRATSATNPAAPVPSTTVPLVIRTSNPGAARSGKAHTAARQKRKLRMP